MQVYDEMSEIIHWQKKEENKARVKNKPSVNQLKSFRVNCNCEGPAGFQGTIDENFDLERKI